MVCDYLGLWRQPVFCNIFAKSNDWNNQRIGSIFGENARWKYFIELKWTLLQFILKLSLQFIIFFMCNFLEIFGQSTFDKHRRIRNLLITIIGGYTLFTSLLLPFLIVYFRNEDVYFVNFLTPEYWKPIKISNIGPLVFALCFELWYETTTWGGFAFVKPIVFANNCGNNCTFEVID